QHQAFLGLDGVDAARQGIPRQREIINVRVLPAQGKLEPALAVLVAMTRAGVAPRFGENRHDIVAKRHLGSKCGCRSWNCGLRERRATGERQKDKTTNELT